MGELRVETASESASSRRQTDWRVHSIERLTAARAARLTSLELDEEAIKRALSAYQDLPTSTGTVSVRTDFVALSPPRPLSPALAGTDPTGMTRAEVLAADRRSRPPMTKLIIRATHSLSTYLSMLYVTQSEVGSGPGSHRNRHSNASRIQNRESWAVLCGRWAPTTRSRRARIGRDLDELQKVDLVSVHPAGAKARYEGFELLADDTSDRAYRLPPSGAAWPSVMTLPTDFFLRGWHLALTPSEIAVLLMIRHASRAIPQSKVEPGVGLAQSVRWSTYGISGEAYGAIHELAEFGLLKVHDTMPHRRRGKFQSPPADERAELEAAGESFAPVPYRFELEPDSMFSRPALATVNLCLLNSSVPPRISPMGSLLAGTGAIGS